MKRLISTLILVVTVVITFAQDHSDTLLHLMEKAAIPGMSLAYVKDGKVREHYALGVKSADTKQPVDDSTIFSAASLSKSIFFYVVFLLVQEKKLDLDKPLYTYYQYKDVAGDPRSKQVTARMIMSHSAGLPNWRNSDSLQFIFSPGEKFSYSGEGTVWLSRVVEAIVGKNMEAYITEKIFRPLGMNHTSYIWKKDFDKDFAYPHNELEKSMDKYYPGEPNVAHSLQTTALDYAKFLSKVLQDKKFIAAFQKEPAMTVADHLTWGLGLGHQTSSDGLAFFQWGDNGTFKAFLIGYPAKKEGLVYFVNGSQGLRIARDILGVFISRDQPGLSWLETDSADAPDLRAFENSLHTPVADAVAPYYKRGTSIVDTNQLSIASLIYIGNRFIRYHEYNKAIDFFKEGLKADPNSDKCFAKLAETYLRSGDRAAAIAEYKNAARTNPQDSSYQAMIDRLNGIYASPKQNQKMVKFRLPDYVNARYVSLAGSFNNWNDLIEPMRWENGAWITSVPLASGKYRYKFVIDGVWLNDTNNPKFVPQSFDSELIVE